MAEGIETPAQIEFTTAHGCYEGQGDLLYRPVPPIELIERLRTAAKLRAR